MLAEDFIRAKASVANIVVDYESRTLTFPNHEDVLNTIDRIVSHPERFSLKKGRDTHIFFKSDPATLSLVKLIINFPDKQIIISGQQNIKLGDFETADGGDILAVDDMNPEDDGLDDLEDGELLGDEEEV